MQICGKSLVGLSRRSSWRFGFFVLFFIGFLSAYPQAPLHQLAVRQQQKFAKDKEQFIQAKSTWDGGFEFSRYSPLGVPLFLATLNFNSARATGTTTLTDAASGIRLQGDGMQMAAWDDGLVASHIELGARVVATEGTQLKTHATHVAGTLIASGINPAARGMAPHAQLLAFRFDNDEAEMAVLAASTETPLLLSNHSYGTVTGWTNAGGAWRWVGNASVSEVEDYNFGLYTAKAELVDEIASLAPYYTICWAAGNDRGEPGDGSRPPDCNGGTGFDCIIPDAVAKNIITVGAIEPLVAYTSPASVVMSSYSSWGPTDDGRIKPDLVGIGSNVFSLSAAPANSYTVLSGTSMATPNVSGSLLLLQELHKKLGGGKPMRAATLKALAIHTAKEAGDFAGPDYRFGWGLLDTQAAAQVLLQRDGVQTIVQESTLKTGETWTLNINPQSGRKITITLAWTDVPATPAPDQLDPPNLALVNDLDIRLVDDQGTTHFPWILNPASPADRATRGDNFRDNIEKIELDAPAARPYQIRLSHKGVLRQGKQDYSIVVTYSANAQSRTLYWIGDEGNWNDATKWSLASGGPAAFTVPTSNDRVIIDENSFQNEDVNAIQLNAPVTIRSLIWLASKPAGIEFNGSVLTVTSEVKIASSAFRSSSGLIQLSNSTAARCSFDVFNVNAPQLQLRFVNGYWRIRGSARVRSIETNISQLEMDEVRFQLESWRANVAQAAQWSFMDSELLLTKEFDFLNAGRIAATATKATVKFRGDVRMRVSDLAWPLTTVLDSGALTWEGTGNFFRSFETSGVAVITGSNRFDRIEVNSGSVTFAAATRQLVASLRINSGVSIEGGSSTVMELVKPEKFCFDQLRISDVALTGIGAVSVGTNSVLLRASGWQSVACANTLFAHFTMKYPCQGGQTVFLSSSSGMPDRTVWVFAQGDRSGNADGIQSHFQFSNTGSARVMLTVSRGTDSHIRDSVIHIRANTISENEILATSDRLTSFLAAERFEWYRNQQKLEGQNERFIIHNGEPGAYHVLVFQGDCNRWSPVYTVTSLRESGRQVAVYPNPVTERIFVESSEEVKELVIYDLTGKHLKASSGNFAEISDLSGGVYVCEVRTDTGVVRIKFLVQR